MSKIDELVKKINKARKDYYNGPSEISDQLYDAWIDELAKLDPKNSAVIGIGSEPVSDWKKYTHKVPMGSLNKASTEEEFTKWYNSYCKGDEIFTTLKLDGLSLSLVYENGKLSVASTRGSGVTGEAITTNVVKMIGVPLRLKTKENLTVRGEVLLSKENLTKFFPEYSNTRNAASGICRRYDGSGSDKLNVLVYEVNSDKEFASWREKFEYLKELGFDVPDFYVVKTKEEAIKLRDKYEKSLRDKYEFSLDGLVVHNNNLAVHAKHGSLHDRAYASIAYKFDAPMAETTILSIAIQSGLSGRQTPVATFEPVELLGATIERASLHNFANIEALGIDVGAKVLISRSNDVIPYILQTTESTGTIFQRPKTCSSCNTDLIETGEYLQCPNTEECPSQVSGKIKNWIKELNVLEWGPALIDRLIESELVKDISDLYLLKPEQLEKLERMGKKSAKKVHEVLWQTKEIPLDIFLGGLTIKMIGSSTIRLIMNAGFDSLEKIQQMSKNQIEGISGIGPIKAESLFNGLKKNQDLIQRILKNGIKIKNPNEIKEGKLSGKSICFSGKSSLPRKELEKLASDNGAIVKSSVTRGVTWLVLADKTSTSSKAVSARSLGTEILSEEDFMNMIK